MGNKLIKLGNRVLDLITILLILFLLSLSIYAAWYSWYLYHNSFLSSELAKYKPTEESGRFTLEELHKLNPDVIGWLTIDDTNIDYPLVQGKDDMEYLNKDALGNFSISGSLFLSYENAPDFSDSYNMVYGHHMDNGAMFTDIELFMEQDFFEEHPYGVLELLDGKYEISIFASVETDAYDEVIYQTPQNVKPEDLEKLTAEIMKKATQSLELEITKEDHIIAMSTCTDATTNGRLLLFGRLDELPDQSDESETENTNSSNTTNTTESK